MKTNKTIAHACLCGFDRVFQQEQNPVFIKNVSSLARRILNLYTCAASIQISVGIR